MAANPLCPIPGSINPLSPTGFQLAITKLPEVSYFCQIASIPEVTLENVNVPTPLSINKVPGELLRFGDLVVNFMIDEKMANYSAIWNWLIGLGFPQDYIQYQQLINGKQNSTTGSSNPTPLTPQFGTQVGNYSDGTLSILGSNNVAVRSIYFVDLHPVSLGSLEFQSNVDDVQYLTGTATFGYTYFTIL